MANRDIARVLTEHSLFVEGEGYAGKLNEQVLPVITRTKKDYKPAGYSSPVAIYTGFEKMESSYTLGEYEPFVLKQFRRGEDIRLVSRGAARNNEGDQSIVVTVGGSMGSVNFGTWGTGDVEGTLQFSVDVSFYELIIDGEEIYYFDVKNGIYRVGGVDENQSARENLNF